MNENSRYQWKEMPNNHHDSFNYIDFFNDNDLDTGYDFVVIDTLTGKEYIIPEKDLENLIIPYDLCNSQEFWYWAYSALTPKLLEILVLATKDGRIFDKIPKHLLTQDLLQKVVDEEPRCIRWIPDELITEELIYYALSKKVEVLEAVPTKKLTQEMCLYAVNKSAFALLYVPRKYKTYDMCLNAVISKPRLIKKVPVKFLNSQFIEDLQLANIHVPSYATSYVKKCLLANELIEQEDLSTKANSGKTREETIGEANVYEGEFAKIKLETLPGFFTQSTLNFLQKNHINTVGDLLTKAEAPDFIISLGKRSIANEIYGAVKLIRCKYLDEDPLIDETDELGIISISHKMGFSNKITNCLRAARFTPENFFKLMRQPGIRERELIKIRNIGQSGIFELVNKTQIVIDYHDRHKKKENDSSNLENLTSESSETLESLKEEYTRLRLEMARLSMRTDEVLTKIQEKMLEQSKGGVLK